MLGPVDRLGRREPFFGEAPLFFDGCDILDWRWVEDVDKVVNGGSPADLKNIGFPAASHVPCHPRGPDVKPGPVTAQPGPFAVEVRPQAAEALKDVGGIGCSYSYLRSRQLKAIAPLAGRDASGDNERASRGIGGGDKPFFFR